MSKVVVITGASSGIGAGLARRLGQRGDRLLITARREEELHAVASGLPHCEIVSGDVRDRAHVEHVRDVALERYGHVDVWVNNAGRGITRSVLDLTEADVDEMVAINVKSALYGMQAIVPHFVARGRGHLLNVSSFLGKVPLAPFRSAYSGAKAMLNALTACLAADLAGYPDIHVTSVLPGAVLTDFASNVLGGQAAPGAFRGAAPAQTTADVVAAIAGVLDNPVAEVYTNPVLGDVAVEYVRDVEAFSRARR